MDIKLPFGMRSGKVIHISEVPIEEKGLKCDCLCPECGEPLVARLGDVRIHHFAHSNTSCVHALETALHYFAKEVLEKYKQIRLPYLNLNYTTDFTRLHDFELYNNYGFGVGSKNREVVKESVIYFDEIECEKKLDNIKPDIVIYKNQIPLLIEIAVTHYVDKVKLSKIKSLGISTIEIDLGTDEVDFYNFNKHEIENLIIEATHRKRWVYNRLAENEKLNIIEENKRLKQEEKIKRQEEQKRQQHKLIMKRKQEEAKINRIKRILDDSNYKRKLEKFQSNIIVDKKWIEISDTLNVRLNTLPEFLNIKVPGELAIDCDRRIWQSMIFHKFIINRKRQSIVVSEVIEWIKTQSGLTLNNDLLYTKELVSFKAPDLTDAIFGYFSSLEKYKIINCTDYYNKYYAKYKVKIDDIELIKGLTKSEIIKTINQIEEQERYNRFWGVGNKPYKSTEDTKKPVITNKESESKELTNSIESTLDKKTQLPSVFSSTSVSLAAIYNKIGTCISCGKETDDWVSYNGADGTCVCRKCRRKEYENE